MSSRIRVTHNIDALAGGHPQHGARAVGHGEHGRPVAGADRHGRRPPSRRRTSCRWRTSSSTTRPRVVNRLSVAAPTQVNLQVRIAEVARNVDRQLGIQWNDVSVGINGGRIGFRGGRPVQGDYQASYGAIRGSFNIDVVLQALQEEGLVTIMAEPNLTARSGEPATFLAGGEYPYSTVSDNGTNVQFKNFGIGLNFTPDGDRRQPHQPDGRHRGERAQLRPERDGAVAQDPARRDDGRPRQRPELRHRRADGEQLVAGRLAGAGARHDAGDRRALPQPGLQARAERARHHRDAGHRQPDLGQADLDAGRQLRAAERLRAHPARPLPGQPARRRAGAEQPSASAAWTARPASSSSKGHDR